MVSDETLIEALEAVVDIEEQPVANGELVAASLPIEGEAARQRLLRIAADGEISTAKVGGARVFWSVDALRESAAPEPAKARMITDTDDSPSLKVRVGESPDVDPHPSDGESGSPFDDHLELVDVPGWDDDVVADRRAALELTLQLLDERGPMRRREILDEVYPEHTGDYGSRESLWTNWLQDALSTLADEGQLERATGTHDDEGWDLLD